MSEVWREEYESYKNNLLDNLETLFAAASLNYLNDENKIVEWLYGELDDYSEDKVLRVMLANWASKKNILIEKPLEGADEDYSKSLFSGEEERVSFFIYITDIFHRDLSTDTPAFDGDIVECLRIEVYQSGKVALLYFGYPGNDENENSEDSDIGFIENQDYRVKVIMNGLELLGAEFSSQSPETHNGLVRLINSEISFDYWMDDFKYALHNQMDDYVQQCTDKDN